MCCSSLKIQSIIWSCFKELLHLTVIKLNDCNLQLYIMSLFILNNNYVNIVIQQLPILINKGFNSFIIVIIYYYY